MINHIWTILCEKSIIDGDTNNLSIMQVIEEVIFGGEGIENVEDKYIQLPINFELVSLWEKTTNNKQGSGEVTIKLIDPDGKEIKDASYPFVVNKEHMRQRTRLRFMGLPVKKEGGVHYFIIGLKKGNKNKEVARIPLNVKRDK